ncbi:MAG: hypothetical protein LBP92_05295 [Deltaproteobacteria bacterium]|nr:hypothetical protein [Deltaproteobacteria bacterium]
MPDIPKKNKALCFTTSPNMAEVSMSEIMGPVETTDAERALDRLRLEACPEHDPRNLPLSKKLADVY